MANERIIEGVEYTVVDSAFAQDDGEAGTRADIGTNGSARPGEGYRDGDADGVTGSVAEYARALQIYGADRDDRGAALEVAILGWLDAKRGRSGSERTWRIYADTLASFRAALRREGLDLDGPPTPVALVAQAWAGYRTVAAAAPQKRTAGTSSVPSTPSVGSADPCAQPASSSSRRSAVGSAPGQVAPTTYNQRLASVSSFYRYARKHEILQNNPIERVERRQVQPYAGARALDEEDVAKKIDAIDCTTLAGVRDYALLSTYLQTGRRLSEVAALELRDLEERPGGKLRLTFRRCKGGKVMHDTLPPTVSSPLLNYLHKVYGSDLERLDGETPVWISLAERNGTRGGRLSKVSISRICKARLGTTRLHKLRSTLAQMLEKIGAPVSFIQQQLGHTNLATTGIYLAALREDDSPYAEDLADRIHKRRLS